MFGRLQHTWPTPRVDPFAIDAGHPHRVRQCNHGREHGLWRPERAPDVKQSSPRRFGRWRAMLDGSSLEVMQRGENTQREAGRTQVGELVPGASKPEWAVLALKQDRWPVRLS